MRLIALEWDRAFTTCLVARRSLDRLSIELRKVLQQEAIGRVWLITDQTVGQLYSERVTTGLAAAGFSCTEFRIPSGEAGKSWEQASRAFHAMAEAGFDRHGLVLALGGGVVSDMAGFVAATWMRGVRLAFCPTTIEAALDAAIGGKNAINLRGLKNLVGSILHPVLVVVDPQCFKSLHPRDVGAGLAESIKHALLSSESFLGWHADHAEEILNLNEPVVEELIANNIEIKAGFVRGDERDMRDRRIFLNLGHTLGHAIESCSEFNMRHGECVGLGLLAALRMSEELVSLDRRVGCQVRELMTAFGLPTKLPDGFEYSRVRDVMRLDKKSAREGARFVLLEKIGKPIVCSAVPEEKILAAFDCIRT